MLDVSSTEVSRYATHKLIKGDTRTIDEIVQEIRTPTQTTLDILDRLKAAANDSEEKQKAIKGQLPAFTPAGVFSTRKDSGLKQASNLLVLDFDTVKDDEGRDALRRKLLADPHIAVVFASPRGGLKALALCEQIGSPEDFRLYFKAFGRRYPGMLDESGKNLSRLCYLSHDPDAVLRAAKPFQRPADEGVNFDPPPLPSTQPPAGQEPNENIARHLESILRKGINLKVLDPTNSRHSFVLSASTTAKRYVIGGHLTDAQAEALLSEAVRRAFNGDTERISDALRAYRSERCGELAMRKGAIDPTPSTSTTTSPSADLTAGGITDERLTELYKLIYTPSRQNEPPKLPPVFLLKGVDVGQLGSLTVLKAKTKSGKTTVSLAMWTAFYAAHLENEVDTFGFGVTPPEGKDLCLYLDTEETAREAWDSWDRALRRVGFDSDEAMPEAMRDSHLVLTDIVSNIDKQAVLFDLIEQVGDRLGAIIIDGIADFVRNVNDDIEVDDFLQHLRRLAGRHDVCVVATIHENFASSKARGHLGSDLARRGRAAMRLDKDRDTGVFTLMIEENRVGADNIKVRFKWDDLLQRHVTIDAANIEEILTADVRKILEPYSGQLLTAKDVREVIANGAGIGTEAAKKRLQKYVKDGVIDAVGGGRSKTYRVKHFSGAGKNDQPPHTEDDSTLF